MKLHLILFSFFLLINELYAQESVFRPDQEFVCKDHHHFTSIAFGKKSKSSSSNIDVDYHRLELEIDPDTLFIKGLVVSYFTTLNNSSKLYFDLSSVLKVDSIVFQSKTLSYNRSQIDLLEIDLGQSLNLNHRDSIHIYYHGVPMDLENRSFVKDFHDSVPIIWTLSQPYGAKDWWPCKQDLNDKIDSIDLIVLTDSNYVVASNGLLIKEYYNSRGRIFHWKHRYPIPAYLVAVAVTNYSRFSESIELNSGESVDLQHFVYPDDSLEWQSSIWATKAYLRLFSDSFDIYPFHDEKYGHAQFSRGGGMEHQTMSFMASTYPPLIGHELAHQWFGNKITCESWGDIWLNEGFASYFTGMAYEVKWPNDWRPWKEYMISDITSENDGSVFVEDTSSISRIFNGRLSYNKGAMLLHMLRWKLGDKIFFQGIRNYLKDPNHSYSYAGTHDLKNHFEILYGENLDEFFSDWFYGEGFPSYQIDAKIRGGIVDIEIHQNTSHPSVEFYEMPLELRFLADNLDSSIRIDHHYSGEKFQFKFNQLIETIEFDPELWIVSANNEINITKTKANFSELYPNPMEDVLNLNHSEIPKSISLFSREGKLLLEIEPKSVRQSIDLSNYSAGLYFISIELTDGVEKLKFIKL